MKIKINLQYLLALLASILLVYYVWFRFIRERLPRDIPFNLTLFSFFILCFTCSVYLYIIYYSIKPKPINLQLLNMTKNLGLPFYTLNDLIQNNIFVNPMSERFIKRLTSTLAKRNFFEFEKSSFLFFLYNLVSRVLFLIIFYFHQINLSYHFIFLGIIPLLNNYIIYLMKKTLEKYKQDIKKYYYIKIMDEDSEDNNYYFSPSVLTTDELDCIDLEYFLQIQVASIQFSYTPYKYYCIETWEARNKYAKEHNIEIPSLHVFLPNNDNISQNLSKAFYNLMPTIINIATFLDCYKSHLNGLRIKKINIYITSVYFICWLHILIISLSSLNIMDLLALLKSIIRYIPEPFSQALIYNNEDKT